MKIINSVFLAATLAALGIQDAAQAQGPVGTAFTYQGQLKDGGIPADDSYDFLFRLFDSSSGGSQVGDDVRISAVHVTDGLFTVQLDFGAGIFTGDALWLEVGVRQGFDPYTTLSPRQPLNAAPYALYALDGPGSAGFWAASGTDIYNTNSGNVGIGTSTPVASLQVINNSESHAIWAETGDIAVYAHRTGTSGTWPAVHGECDSLSNGTSGVRGVISSTNPGSESAGVYGVNHGTGLWDGYGVRGHHDGAGAGVYGYAPSGRGVQGVSDTGTGVSGSSDSFYGVYGGSTSYVGVWGQSTSDVGVRGTSAEHDGVVGVNNGGNYKSGVYGETTATNGYGVFGRNNAPFVLTEGHLGGPNYGVWGYAIDSLEEQWWTTGYVGGSAYAVYGEAHGSAIAARFVGNVEIASAATGATLIEFGEGLDYAEGFDVSDRSPITPGTVVVIDPDRPGKLVTSDTPYDRKVAGIVAGANGLGSAVRLGAAQFDHDVALAGRVYCNVDATYGAIQPGDLLTTSPTPGYAMKVTDYTKAQGAVLGKAMEPLNQGEKGQILVLVTLQ
jgi:hypothetical protein